MKIMLRYNTISTSFAVFNNHINDADALAREVMRNTCPELLNRLEEIEKKGEGIMYIFNVPQEPATSMYAHLVTAFVNIEGVYDDD